MSTLAGSIRKKVCMTAIIGIATLSLMSLASASVVITGTRVIYPGDASEKTVQLINQIGRAHV